MSALWILVLTLLGWTYTDQSGIVHYDNCTSGAIMLYEDMSYTVYPTSNVVSCIEYYTAPDSLEPTEIYIMQIDRITRTKYYVGETYYRPDTCEAFPECLELNEWTLYLYTSRK